MPLQSSLKGANEKQRILCQSGCDPLDAALRLAQEGRRVALLRCTALEHPHSEYRTYHNIHEDQLFFRSTYFEAFERMEEDIQAVVDDSIKEGGILYTSGVGILRGSFQDGMPWVEKPPQVDVAWFGLPLHPHHGEQEIYSETEERNFVSSTLDRVFAWACAHGADAIVMPPFACNMGGFLHPRHSCVVPCTSSNCKCVNVAGYTLLGLSMRCHSCMSDTFQWYALHPSIPHTARLLGGMSSLTASFTDDLFLRRSFTFLGFL
eukprot:symbB.v1.2.013767.t1/scaffold983.1/size146703/2